MAPILWMAYCRRLIRLLDGFYVDLAITRHGSRVLDQCFKAAQETQKLYIAKELSNKANMLKGSPFGRLIYTKYRLDTYKLSASQWQASLGQQLQKQEDEKEGKSKKRSAKTATEGFTIFTTNWHMTVMLSDFFYIWVIPWRNLSRARLFTVHCSENNIN